MHDLYVENYCCMLFTLLKLKGETSVDGTQDNCQPEEDLEQTKPTGRQTPKSK